MYDFFTGLDVEHYLKDNRQMLTKAITGFDVYTDRVVFYKKSNTKEEEVFQGICEFFESKYDKEKKRILFDHNLGYLEVIVKEIGKKATEDEIVLPLFHWVAYKQIEQPEIELPGIPIVSFYSSVENSHRVDVLYQYAKDYLSIDANKEKNILIVDANIDMAQISSEFAQDNVSISFIDFLGFILNNSINSVGTWPVMKDSNGYMIMPVCRYQEQLLDSINLVSKIVSDSENPFTVTEGLSLIGQKLGADIILIDLCNGYSNNAAPFLLDARVENHLITSLEKCAVNSTKNMISILNKNECQYKLVLADTDFPEGLETSVMMELEECARQGTIIEKF